MPTEPVERRRLLRVRGPETREIDDWVGVEEPLEIRVEGAPLATLMRTPGEDIELAAGFALTEGVVRRGADLGTIRHCDAADGARPESAGNAVDIGLVPGVTFDRDGLRRHLIASAACGICGRATLDALADRAAANRSTMRVARSLVASLPDRLEQAQGVFRRTGALHAAALFDATGNVLAVRE